MVKILEGDKMNNTIEILDKETNTKQVYVLKEETEEIEQTTEKEIDYSRIVDFFKILIKLTIKVLKFTLYLVISFLELFIKVIKVLFNINEYKPFQGLVDIKDNILDDRAKKNISKERIKFATEKLTRHTYEFERSDLYLNTYKDIQEKLKDFSDNNVAINNDIYKDILAKIDVLTVEVEKKALQEGYNYAAFTKYRLSDEEVYEDFIEYKIMKGEGHGKADKEHREGTD